MKKVILSFYLLAVTMLTYAQKNLIKDGRFENTSFSVNDINRKLPEKGVWYPYLTSDRQAVLSTQKDGQKGNVVSIQTLSNVSYAYSFVGQNIAEAPASGVYKVSFYAKSTTDLPTYISVYLRIRTSPREFLLFPINGFKPKETPTASGGLKQIRLTKDWALYSVEFDLSKTISTVSSLKNAGEKLVINDATDANWKSFDLAISCTTKNSGLLFTDVSFTKK